MIWKNVLYENDALNDEFNILHHLLIDKVKFHLLVTMVTNICLFVEISFVCYNGTNICLFVEISFVCYNGTNICLFVEISFVCYNGTNIYTKNNRVEWFIDMSAPSN